MAASEISFNARLHEVLNGVHRKPPLSDYLAAQAERTAKAIAADQRFVAQCATDSACRRRERLTEPEIADAIKAERDRALRAGWPEVDRLLTDLAELRAIL
jgi:broad specificity phosphatase PhoE